MRKIILPVALLLLAIAAPAAAAWRQTATELTWHVTRSNTDPKATPAEIRDALLDHYTGTALDGALATAARPRIALTDLGNGTSEVAITMGRTAGETWIAAYATRACPTVDTNGTRAACVDAAIRSDLRRIVTAYKRAQRDAAHPAPEVDDL